LRAVIRADNPQAIAFYLQQGFRIIGTAERHAYINGTFIDEVIAEKMLGTAVQ
jgi:RimJ/RimL family protein N-acetyltransferase